MEQHKLEELVSQGLSQRDIAKEVNKGQTTVRYYLKKYDLRTKRGPRGKLPKDFEFPRRCPCGETDPNNFYGKKRYICSKCSNTYNLEKGRKRRAKALEYLGGICTACSFNKYNSSLHIHHLDPTKKDPKFRQMRYWSWSRLEAELQHCTLLCANCHFAVHNNELTLEESK